eukprot:3607983-Rhodomonas_salina.2
MNSEPESQHWHSLAGFEPPHRCPGHGTRAPGRNGKPQATGKTQLSRVPGLRLRLDLRPIRQKPLCPGRKGFLGGYAVLISIRKPIGIPSTSPVVGIITGMTLPSRRDPVSVPGTSEFSASKCVPRRSRGYVSCAALCRDGRL